jgi:hypothetical protein
MHYWFFGFWWLIFPLGWFVIAGWMSWLSYLRRKQELDLLHRYAEQGKEPPPEVAKAVSGDPMNGYGHPYAYYGWGRPWRWWRFSPYWAFNRAVVTGAVAGGLYYWANYVNDDPHAARGVMIAVVVLGIISVSSLVSALFMMANPPK